MHDYFSRRLDDIDETLRPVDLQTSFRSAPAILKAVDNVFAPDHARAGVASEPSGISRHGHERVKTIRSGGSKSGRSYPREKKTAARATWTLPLDYEDEHDPQAELAAIIAKKIKDWLKNGEALPEQTGQSGPAISSSCFAIAGVSPI